MTRRSFFLLTSALLLATSVASLAAAPKCFNNPADATQVGNARTAIDAACKCFAFDDTPGNKHGNYVSCAVGVINTRLGLGQLRPQCKGTVRKFYAESVCGSTGTTVRPFGPVVACVARNTLSGNVRCSIKNEFDCFIFHVGRIGCFGSTNCIDAADTNGDQKINASDSGNCTAGSFTDNGDGTITDNNTGLMWEKKSMDGSLDDVNNCYPWAFTCSGDNATMCSSDTDCTKAGGTCQKGDCQAASPNGKTIFQWVDQLNTASFAGHTDWRIPTIAELQTLIRPLGPPTVAPEFNSACAPGCSVTTCSCTAGSTYWSSTSLAGRPKLAWTADFDQGFPNGGFKSTALFARGVRAGS